MEEEIDLRAYVGVLFRRWPVILGLALVAAVAAGLVSFLLLSPIFEATALIAVVKSRSEITFEPRFRTITEEDLLAAGQASAAVLDRKARLQSFSSLVQDPEIARSVLQAYPDLFVPENPEDDPATPADLLRMVEGEVFENSDLIAIKVTAGDPEKAATIANAWAHHFVASINQTYGGEEESLVLIGQQVTEAKTAYETTEEALRQFIVEQDRISELQRLVQEKETIITSLRAGKQAAVSAVIDRQIEIQSQLINAYMEASAANRLLAFNKGQEAKRAVVAEWLDFERESRLAVLRRDRNLRERLFNTFVQAEADSRLAVFNEQVSEKLSDLSQAYGRRDRYQKFLVDARAMLAQVKQGGQASAASNSLALLLLKAEIFAASGGLPGDLQLQILASPSEITADQQEADVTALISVLENQLALLDDEIHQLSEALLQGTGYTFLDELDPEAWTLTGAVPLTATVASLSDLVAQSGLAEDSLSAKILERYVDLYDVGLMARLAEQVDEGTPLFDRIQQLYPALFEKDPWMELTSDLPEETELTKIGREEAQRLLDLEGIDELLGFTVEEEPLTQQIALLEKEVRELQADISRLQSLKQDLEHSRDLVWQTYSTLSTKETELAIASQSLDSEVRFAVPATPLRNPIAPRKLFNVAVAGALGLMLGVFGAFALEWWQGDEMAQAREPED